MSGGDEIIFLHSGTYIEISALNEFLYQNYIASIIRDDFQSSTLAGWVAPASMQNIKLFVKKSDFIIANHLKDKFLKEQELPPE